MTLNDFLVNRVQSQISAVDTKVNKINSRVGTIEANVIAEKTYWSGPIKATDGSAADWTTLPSDFSPRIPSRIKVTVNSASSAETEKLKITIDGITCSLASTYKPDASPVIIPLAAFGLQANVSESTKNDNDFVSYINISCTDKSAFANNFIPFISNSGDFDIIYGGKTYSFHSAQMVANNENAKHSDYYVYDMHLMYHVELSTNGKYSYPTDTSAAKAQRARLTGFIVFGNQYDVADFKLTFTPINGVSASS